MATCPQGHESATSDYCDRCGTPIAAADPGSGAGERERQSEPEPELSSATQVRMAAPPGEPCPVCQTPRRAGDRYCERDGYDFEAPDAPESPDSTWCAVVTTDRARFDALHPDDLVFPTDAPAFTCVLDGDSVTVGRRSQSRGIFPTIDLGGTYEDPGVSREHLRFDRAGDGSYTVVDCGSANGTTLNDDPSPLTPDVPRPLADGDRVHLGAWTTITIERQPTGTSSP